MKRPKPTITHRSTPVNPNRIERGDTIRYYGVETRHTSYRIPSRVSLYDAIQRVNRYKPNAYALQIIVRERRTGEKVRRLSSDPFDPADGLFGIADTNEKLRRKTDSIPKKGKEKEEEADEEEEEEGEQEELLFDIPNRDSFIVDIVAIEDMS